MMRWWENDATMPKKLIIVRPVSVVRPTSVTDNLRGKLYDLRFGNVLV